MSTIAPVPLTRTIHVELRKMVDTRAGRWLIGVMSGLSLVVAVVLVIWGTREELTLQTFVAMMSMPLVMLLPIVGIMAATQEWSQRTGLVTFTLEPRRGRVVLAKLVAAVVLGLVVVAASGLVAALFHAGVTTFADAPGDWTLHGAATAGLVLALVMYVLQGVGFGLAFLSTPVAIVASLVLPTVWTIATAMIPRVSGAAEWLDLSLVTAPLMEGQMGSGDWARLGTSAVAWIGLPIAVGIWRVLTREVK
jgi:ABC-2 type transport system permease protein